MAPDARLFRSRRLVTVAIAGIALLDLVENTAVLGFLAERPLDPILAVLPVTRRATYNLITQGSLPQALGGLAQERADGPVLR